MIYDSSGNGYTVANGVAVPFPRWSWSMYAASDTYDDLQWERFRGVWARRTWLERLWDWFTTQSI